VSGHSWHTVFGRRACGLLFFAAALAACVPYPADQLPDDGRGNSQYGIVEGAYPGLDAGASELQGLHFKVKAYGAQVAQDTSDMCERAYTRIMTDTGLYSFSPRGMYAIVV